jgi:Glycosyl transferase family 21
LLKLSYVLPLRWVDDSGLEEMTEYLSWLSEVAEVIVVDGSSAPIYSRHASMWPHLGKHIPPAPGLKFLNGKVNGVITGVAAATHQTVVIADDDIRYDLPALMRLAEHLESSDLVIAQSYFEPTSWHTQWDTARILLNRAFGLHFPATLAVRREFFLAMGGYDGDVLFENLELLRTARAAGGVIDAPQDLFVRHLPATPRNFWMQRVRQAYDDFAIPVRMSLWLALAPYWGLAIAKRQWQPFAITAALSIMVAEVGRARASGRTVYPPTATLFAPLWLVERALSAWIAVGYRFLRGGVPYREGVIARSATPLKTLRSRRSSMPGYPHPVP